MINTEKWENWHFITAIHAIYRCKKRFRWMVMWQFHQHLLSKTYLYLLHCAGWTIWEIFKPWKCTCGDFKNLPRELKDPIVNLDNEMRWITHNFKMENENRYCNSLKVWLSIGHHFKMRFWFDWSTMICFCQKLSNNQESVHSLFN